MDEILGRQRTVPFRVTLGLLVVAVIGVAVFMNANAYTQIDPRFPETAEAADVATSNFSATAASDWHYIALAERDIQEFGAGQRILDGIVVDPTDGAIAYFATSAFDEDAGDMTLSIYRYNTQDLSFTRLYRSVYGRGESRHIRKSTWPVWHVIGYDNERLVILLEDKGRTASECEEPLLVGIESTSATLLTLSLNDLTGLEAYTPQEEDLAGAAAALASCTAE